MLRASESSPAQLTRRAFLGRGSRGLGGLAFSSLLNPALLQGQALKCFGPLFDFKKFGSGGAEICELFPEIGGIADEITIIRSMTTDAINHDPAHCFMNTGTMIAGRPSMGSWVTYGLGS